MLGIRKLSFILVTVAASASAQTVDSVAGSVVSARTATLSPSVAAGELVRVWAPRARLDGAMASFVRIDSNLVIAGQALHPDAPPREWAVPVDAVERLDVRRGRSRSAGRIAAGIVIGALVGAAIGAPATHFIECGGDCEGREPKESRRVGAAIGAPIGALIGGVIGGMSRPRWYSVTITR